ncbi:TetR/AcrR family transcriptional regulator [Streptomyces monashensis]|uniref:TetR/AcrR family transcriptional regulator n=1 Tax=Streptomyces monashensis TaxID=1678012 RepID=UPI003F5409B4
MPNDEKPTASVWTRPRPRQRGHLTREQIVAEAIRLLDAEGVEELSVRKLGTRLGTAATSLYQHVANKDELIELVVEDIYGEPDVPSVVDGTRWRAAVTHTATELRLSLNANARLPGDTPWSHDRKTRQNFELRTWIIDHLGPDTDSDWDPEALAADTLAALALDPGQVIAQSASWRDLPTE